MLKSNLNIMIVTKNDSQISVLNNQKEQLLVIENNNKHIEYFTQEWYFLNKYADKNLYEGAFEVNYK